MVFRRSPGLGGVRPSLTLDAGVGDDLVPCTSARQRAEFIIALSDHISGVRYHQLVPKIFEGILVQNLCEDISKVLFGWNILGCHDIPITKCLHPALAAVDMLELGLLSRSLAKYLCQC